MFDRVVVGVRGRPRDHQAIELGRALAEDGGTLVLVHVAADDVPLDAAERAATLVAEAHPGVTVQVEIARDVAAGLRAAARRSRAEVVVIGGGPSRTLRHLLVPGASADATRCPTTIAFPPADPAAQSPEALRTIAIDEGGEFSFRLPVARTLAWRADLAPTSLDHLGRASDARAAIDRAVAGFDAICIGYDPLGSAATVDLLASCSPVPVIVAWTRDDCPISEQGDPTVAPAPPR